MAPNKEWIRLTNIDHLSEDYNVGVIEFLNYAFEKTGEAYKIQCPCVRCNNTNCGSRDLVHTHLITYGIMENYTFWFHHGERRHGHSDEEESEEEEEEEDGDNDDDQVEDVVYDLYPDIESNASEPNGEARKFYRLLNDLDQTLYPGCKTSKLHTLVKLLYIKSVGRWSNKSFDMLLQVLKEILPNGSTLPESYYEAKRIIKDLGLSYDKIDACGKDTCKICGLSRWKDDIRSGETKLQRNGKRIPVKTMRYFPLKPRLQRLFMSKKTASLMRWHIEEKVDDDTMTHPAHSPAWKHFDELHKNFSSDPRNVRLGLATDGFQPFNHSKTSYSIWPIILIPYNLPPWMCMKDPNFILSTLIPGPEGPGDAIDIYLQPLIEELKELWEVGVETYDASRRENFTLHACLLWTINDFPAYAILSGWSTKGKMACPWCNTDTSCLRLAHCQKQCYLGHRRYIEMDNKWRKDKDKFDGTKELRPPPKPLSGSDIIAAVTDLEGIILSKDLSKKTKISHAERGDNWNKKSILFELFYWSTNLVPHNFDVMHIEKNICDNILGTIMNVSGKTKDDEPYVF
ncbi:hypothetical protein M5689_020778 [Euphorbia peplus]|nr:hypothetical protein M5689_020778 [Euphorbia peplus]